MNLNVQTTIVHACVYNSTFRGIVCIYRLAWHYLWARDINGRAEFVLVGDLPRWYCRQGLLSNICAENQLSHIVSIAVSDTQRLLSDF